MEIVRATPRALSPSIVQLNVLTQFTGWQEDGNSTFTTGVIIPFQIKGANYWSTDGKYQVSWLLEADGKSMVKTNTFMLTTWDNTLNKYLRYELRDDKISSSTGEYNPQKREITWNMDFENGFTSIQIQNHTDEYVQSTIETFKDGELFRMVSSKTVSLK